MSKPIVLTAFKQSPGVVRDKKFCFHCLNYSKNLKVCTCLNQSQESFEIRNSVFIVSTTRRISKSVLVSPSPRRVVRDEKFCFSLCQLLGESQSPYLPRSARGVVRDKKFCFHCINYSKNLKVCTCLNQSQESFEIRNSVFIVSTTRRISKSVLVSPSPRRVVRDEKFCFSLCQLLGESQSPYLPRSARGVVRDKKFCFHCINYSENPKISTCLHQECPVNHSNHWFY